jgi:glycosyltransferase involved in cell wall biosynthesis
MRIALLDPPSFTVPYDHSLASALGRRGHDVHLLTSPYAFGEVPPADGYRREELFLPLSGRLIRAAPRTRLRYALKALDYGPSVVRLRRRLGGLAPDVVHVQWLSEPRVDVHWLRGVAQRWPTVLTAHEIVPRLERNLAAWRETLRLAQRVVVHSRRGAEQLADQGVPPDRIVRIRHPVFASAQADEPRAPDGATILFFGLLRRYKGVDVLLRAVAQVPDARLVVAGDPLEPVDPLRRLADDLGIAGRVEWRLGFVPEEEVGPLMQDATLVALPYRRIDSSGVLATALGYGRPVVVTDVGELGDTVQEFGAGRVVPPEDDAALAGALTTLLTDETALTNAYRGALRAREALTWDAAAEAHERLYESVLR